MFHPFSEKNKFGYYNTGTLNTYSRFEALELAQRTGETVTWNFNQELYTRYNWTVPPVEDLNELYRRRAQQLRDNYDYIVLLFSGGIDSTHTLHSFIDNGIRLDEVCSIHESNGVKNPWTFCTGEIFFQALPHMKKITNSGLTNTKFRMVDTSDAQAKAFLKLTVDSRDQSYYDFNAMNNIGSVARWELRDIVDDYKKIIESGKRLCFLYGEGKPVIDLDQLTGKHKFIFDSHTCIDLICPPRIQRLNHPGYFSEMFYHGDPDIVIKQSHLLLPLLNNPNNLLFVDTDSIPENIMLNLPGHSYVIRNPLPSRVRTRSNNRYLALKKDVMHNIIYPGIDPPEFDQGKNPNSVYNPRDEWLRKLDPVASKKWYTGYIQYANRLGALKKNKIREFNNYYFIE